MLDNTRSRVCAGTRKNRREGTSFEQLFDMFPDEEAGTGLVRGNALAGRGLVSALWRN